MSCLQNSLGVVFLAILWLTKSGVRRKLMTVCENEHEVKRKIAGKTPQIILQVAQHIKTILEGAAWLVKRKDESLHRSDY